MNNFAGQWLQLRNLRNMMPNSDEFPDFDDNLRQAFQRETELFFDSIVREDRSVLDLLTADYTFVNERLARHYKMPDVYGSHFRRVTVTDEARKGLLGKGGVLMVTSHVDRTSPVARGKWILDNLLGTPPPPPPPDVPPFPEGDEQKSRTDARTHGAASGEPGVCELPPGDGSAGVSRSRTSTPSARGARATAGSADRRVGAAGRRHPGRWRGDAAAGAAAAVRDLLVTTLTEKLMTYGVGRGVAYTDMPTVRAIVRESARNDYRFSSLILGIVNSKPFQMRMKAPEARKAPQETQENAPPVRGVEHTVFVCAGE